MQDDDDDDDDEWIDISEDSEEEINDEEINENESTADSDKTTKSSIGKNENETSTLSHSENNSAQNTCEVFREAGSREQKANKVLRKKNALTKQQKKAQKLEKRAKHKSEKNEELTAERKTKASAISVERLLTDKDFRKIDVALAKQDVTYVKRGVKRTREQIETAKGGELVKLSDIENIYKKRKHDKDARQKSVKVRVNCYILKNN